LDVVVHGEPERDDMVRYFAGSLRGFALPEAGWVQSYGSRCVRPPVLYGDVSRPGPISAEWATYAASRTAKAVKGVLTGPVTMLRWSFVRDDQPLADTAVQLALAISDEVSDLEPLSDFKLVTACAELGATGATSDPTTAMRHTLRSLARRWLELHEEIKVHSVHLKALTRAAALQMIAAFGIGLDIAAQMLITAGDNDDRVRMRLPSPSCVGPARSPPVRARPTAGTDSTGAGIAKRTPRCIAP
jgi:hypothetical protein